MKVQLTNRITLNIYLPCITLKVNGDVSFALHLLHYSDGVIIWGLKVPVLVSGSHL